MNARQKGQKLMAALAKQAKAEGGGAAVAVEEAVAAIKASDKARKSAAAPTAKNHLGLTDAPKAAKVKVAKPENKCLCGCGTATKSRFAMGHDSKLKSRLINASLDGDKKATIQIQQLGWVVFLEKSRGSRDRKAAAKAAGKSKEPIA